MVETKCVDSLVMVATVASCVYCSIALGMLEWNSCGVAAMDEKLETLLFSFFFLWDNC